MCEGRAALTGTRSWEFVWDRENNELSWLLDRGTGGHCLHGLGSYFYGWTSAAMAHRRNTFVTLLLLSA
jgi:hypothetical protein